MSGIPCLSLWPPWSSLLVSGWKKIETRHWPLRKPLPAILAIHATASWRKEAVELCAKEPFASALRQITGKDIGPAIESIPLGAVVGLVKITHCVRTDWTREGETATWFPGFGPLTDTEKEFGYFKPGRYAWIVGKAVAFKEPIKAKGMQGLWRWDAPEEFKDVLVDLLGGAFSGKQIDIKGGIS